MTAFARSERTIPPGKLTMEIRSVNNRFLDLVLRLSDAVKPFEPLVRGRLSERVRRGRVELTMRLDDRGAAVDTMGVDAAVIERLAVLQKQVRDIMPKSRRLSVQEILVWPGVMQAESVDDETLEPEVVALLDDLLDDFVATRRREGSRLAELIGQRIETARGLVQGLEARLPQIQVHVRERLQARIAEVLDQVDPERIEQEMVLLLNKSDVEEEIDRLKIHFDEVIDVLGKDQPVGRRLDFLMQELNREANTLGSKAAHADVTNASMELKVLIEQMREQVQNIE